MDTFISEDKTTQSVDFSTSKKGRPRHNKLRQETISLQNNESQQWKKEQTFLYNLSNFGNFRIPIDQGKQKKSLAKQAKQEKKKKKTESKKKNPIRQLLNEQQNEILKELGLQNKKFFFMKGKEQKQHIVIEDGEIKCLKQDEYELSDTLCLDFNVTNRFNYILSFLNFELAKGIGDYLLPEFIKGQEEALQKHMILYSIIQKIYLNPENLFNEIFQFSQFYNKLDSYYKEYHEKDSQFDFNLQLENLSQSSQKKMKTNNCEAFDVNLEDLYKSPNFCKFHKKFCCDSNTSVIVISFAKLVLFFFETELGSIEEQQKITIEE